MLVTAEDSPVAFEDWFDMIQVYGECEVAKYDGDPNTKVDWDRWVKMGKGFILDCFEYGADYDELAEKYGIPRRGRRRQDVERDGGRTSEAAHPSP